MNKQNSNHRRTEAQTALRNAFLKAADKENKMTVAEFDQINSTLEVHGDLEIYTMPFRSMRGLWLVLDGQKTLFVGKKVASRARRRIIKRALNDFQRAEISQ